MDDIKLFEKHWRKFTTRLRGKMMKHSEKQQLTYPVVKLLLSDAVLNWDSRYDESGRWLMDYCSRKPEMGKQIHNVLVDGISFTEVPVPKDYTEVLSYVVPTVGALAGFGMSSLFHKGTLVKAVSTLAPAALLYPSTKIVGTALKDDIESELIDQYMEQLEKYKQSVISILEND